MNGGEKIIKGYSIDGYIELKTSEEDKPYRIGLEYLGCRFHRCEWGCMLSVQTQSEYELDMARLEQIATALDELKIMRSCQWYKIRRQITFDAPISNFLGKNNVNQDMLISAVRKS